MITNKEIQPGVYDGKLSLTSLRNSKETQSENAARSKAVEYKILDSNDGITDSQIYDGSCSD